ncbi:hypothetical protein CL176_09405 [Suicoccus acidiformans]|uniref:Uncharacterized protein n=1 Tax=Suicoccus acidiformans TaxID=2036206 RepID=A0A347WM90_9LACT|nr:hypothetical protein [Suicoccus acidiformans]AXY26197.1 hypothetical protein CL176_09405 [Suicoccus acidiformans]
MWGRSLVNHGGITSEAQLPPDAINQSHLGNVILKPEADYYSKTSYQLHIDKEANNDTKNL